MHFCCKNCETRLSHNLSSLESVELISDEYGENYIPAGYAYLEHRDFWAEHQGSWCINIKDKDSLVKTTKIDRLNGCCDLDGTDGPNMVCASCGSEVATAKLDCWMPHCIVFVESSIRVVP